ncbi:DNA-processing protein DprA [Agrobacterium larrymoorei]|uniref:DNA-processing protein DprA n=1 Tax=Agrobacterium larrymoorei TaxID=160699 RepID=A0A4D7DV43_9HYPH|nr:DNA-processing protein DprA [Agrobacterium larrymoorei]QCI98042.1 DNA-protecting protein DprA [Agrobacterium larrymoorei]QYA06507.1 DNA-processing protein DprA [Agrobacterium larrymoorei]WHA40080.1 DNA-processing protein DprA [Agrobacterium larrymoorei]
MPHDGETRRGIALTERQKFAWLRLIRSDNIGPVTFRELINHFGSAEKALEALPDLARRGGGARSPRIAAAADVERELETADRFGARFVGIGEPDYPPALREIDGAPPLIAMKGSGQTVVRHSFGIVGSRNASINGAKFAAMLARQCGQAGYTIASGLARGIDAAAHSASLSTGTVAMLAGGLDKPYPPENFRLLDEIYANGGATISEMPFGWEPRARDFPRRNRLIAGVSLGVLIVEAAERSGSLITARLAGEFGRLVFAVPGSPLDSRCHGTNRLIKDGAMLVTEAADILDALSPLIEPRLPLQHVAKERIEEGDMSPPGDDERTIIAQALGPSPVETDDIIRHTGLPAATVYLVLLELDIAGRLNRHSGGRVSLIMAD